MHSKFFYVILVHSDFTWAKIFKIYFSLKSSSKSFVEHFQTNGPIKKFWCTRNFSMSFWCTLTSPGQKCSNFRFRSKVVQNHFWNISKLFGQKYFFGALQILGKGWGKWGTGWGKQTYPTSVFKVNRKILPVFHGVHHRWWSAP